MKRAEDSRAHMNGGILPQIHLVRHGETAQNDSDLMEWDYGANDGRRAAAIQAERPGWR